MTTTTSADVLARGVIGASVVDDASLPRYLHALPGVDAVSAHGRATTLGTLEAPTHRARSAVCPPRRADATSDVPGGVVNLLTARTAEVAPWLASHADVNAIDLAGAVGAPVLAFTETKTVWHPMGA